MGMLSILKKIAVKLERQNDSVFTYPIDSQKKTVKHFKEPKNDIERSYYQYQCQMKFNKRYISFVLNLASLPMTLFYLVKASDDIKRQTHFDAVFMSEGISDHVIPDELRNEFEMWKIVEEHGQILKADDRIFLRSIFLKYPFSWHFFLKCLIKIRMYRFEIESHHPSAIVVCGEYSFTSSLLTAYCNCLGIKHINVMHGEKLYYMRDSFFRFDRCYIWDEFYAELFKSLRAVEGQFFVSVPRSMCFSENRKEEKTIDYTYYLGAETGEILSRIANCLKMIAHSGLIVAVRPHPRYSDKTEIKNIFDGILVEDCTEVDIEKSVLRTRNAISCYSTVLNQAYHNHVPVIIDDISDPGKYQKLKELQYIILNINHGLLSELIGEKR